MTNCCSQYATSSFPFQNGEEKKELQKVASKFKLDGIKGRTSTVSGYLNAPPKNLKPCPATERKEICKK